MSVLVKKTEFTDHGSGKNAAGTLRVTRNAAGRFCVSLQFEVDDRDIAAKIADGAFDAVTRNAVLAWR